ncbi:MAG: NAD(+)/NADH kinase [Microbacteriaceae bacterium]|nr:NAD(+)/NADH kinase [Microbacteriaceae bacterium]
MPRMAVVFHPLKVRADLVERVFEAARLAAGWEENAFLATTEDDFGSGIARRAAEDGFDVVTAVGGDGTVREVAAGLRGTGVPMGIVPQGTGNLLARNLGLPLVLERAVEIAYTGRERAIDVGVLEATRQDGTTTGEQVFLVMAGMGVDAEMVRATRPVLKRTIGWVAYADAVARTLPRSKPFRVGYRVDYRAQRTVRVHSMVLANCDMLPGGLRVVPDSQLDDGVFELAAFRPRGIFGVARVWTTVAIGNTLLRRSELGRRIRERRTAPGGDIFYRRGTRAVLLAERPVGVQLDGDDLGDAIALVARLEPRALLVRSLDPFSGTERG